MIDPRKAYTYFTNHFVIKKTSQNWYSFECPFCIDADGKRKMAVQFEYEMCKCWVCGWKGYIVDFVMQYQNLSYFDATVS